MVNCIRFLVVCKIVFCSEFTDIPDNAGKVMRRRRRGTQAIAKRYAFHANATRKATGFATKLLEYYSRNIDMQNVNQLFNKSVKPPSLLFSC